MKFLTVIRTTCIAATALFLQSTLLAQTASPSPSGTPGAPPKFGPEKGEMEKHDCSGGQGDKGGKWKRSPEERLAKLKEALALTPDQETKIRDIFKTEGDKMRAEHQANKGNKPAPEERHAKMQAARQEVETAINAVLTPEQKAKWETMKKQHREHGPERAESSPAPTLPKP
jgi:Spy/CpxP family protein refolding chaperone